MRTAALVALALTATVPLRGAAQAPETVATKAPKSAAVPAIFLSETPLPVTFTTSIGRLRREKDEKSPWHPSWLSYRDSAGNLIRVPVRAKTHGYWRLKNCVFPPIRLNFSGKETRGTVFHGLDKPKLVNFCRDNDQYEQYVLQEYQLYRVYRTLTSVSHHARLLRVTYADSGSAAGDDPFAVRYAFLIEDPEQLAARLGGRLVKVKGASAEDMDAAQAALVYLFEYMIGNTDFSFAALHNAELVGLETGIHLPVAYDFDFSGAVNTSYATVDPAVHARSVRQRVFRGYCDYAAQYPAAAAIFLEKRDAIRALYQDDVGKLLRPGTVTETLAYFDEFFAEIGSPASLAQITRSCANLHGR